MGKAGVRDVKVGEFGVKVGVRDVKVGEFDVKVGVCDVKVGVCDVKVGAKYRRVVFFARRFRARFTDKVRNLVNFCAIFLNYSKFRKSSCQS